MGPIKNINNINKIKTNLKNHNFRNYMIFIIGINTGMKTKYLLNLQVKNLFFSDGTIKKKMLIDKIEYVINEDIVETLKHYFLTNDLIMNNYLFSSNKGENKPINRSHLYRILNNTGYDYKIGNETLRKTFGYHFYSQTKNFNILKYIFKKRSKRELINYLELDIEDEVKTFKL